MNQVEQQILALGAASAASGALGDTKAQAVATATAVQAVVM